MSEVGIIYVLDDELLMDRTPVEEAESYGDFRIHPNDHATWWNEVCLFRSELQGVPYDCYPRGRIVYSVKEQRYTVYLDKCLGTDRAERTRVFDEIRLPRANTEFKGDAHYRCRRCNPGYVEI